MVVPALGLAAGRADDEVGLGPGHPNIEQVEILLVGKSIPLFEQVAQDRVEGIFFSVGPNGLKPGVTGVGLDKPEHSLVGLLPVGQTSQDHHLGLQALGTVKRLKTNRTDPRVVKARPRQLRLWRSQQLVDLLNKPGDPGLTTSIPLQAPG
ncbi:MAG: hypothetical protein RL483_215 [Pseudomonadota bacterium]